MQRTPPDTKFRSILVVVCLCAAGQAPADDRTVTNKVEGSKSIASTTNKVEMAAEQRLLAFFPQLLWPRIKLEFMFEKRARLASTLAAGASSDEEAWKLAKEMEVVFKKGDDIKMFTEGWKMSGRVHSDTVNFSKPLCPLSGITGEIQMLYDRDKLISFSFWTDGSDADFTKLYQLLTRACSSPGRRTIQDKNHAEIDWTITGSTNRYEVQMSHQKWENSGEVERGVTIFVKHPQPPGMSDK